MVGIPEIGVGMTAIIGAILALFGFGILGNVRRKDAFKWSGIILLGVSLVWGMSISDIVNTVTSGKALAVGGADDKPQEIIYREFGSASTVTLNAYKGTWSGDTSKTEVYPAYYILDKAGNIVVDGVNVNTTTVPVGDELTIYGTGSGYYTDTLTKPIENERPTLDLTSYTISGQTDPQIVVYDNTASTALTADDSSNNTADYAGGDIGAGQEELYYAKFTNSVANKVFDLCMVCTYYPTAQEADDFTVEGTESTSSGIVAPTWSEVAIPKKLKDTTIILTDDTGPINGNTSMDYMHCYKSSETVRLKEWDWVKLEFKFDADDSTQPSANGDTYIGAVFMDCSNYKNNNGDILYGAYAKGDNTEDPGTVGVDENPDTTWNGLDTAFAIEPQ